MERTVADTIREITRSHLQDKNGLLLGQCVSAVGWIQNTVPPHCVGIVELPMNDVSGPGLAVGTALAGRRPIFVLRFQSFLWLAVSPLVNYAAKSKEIWGRPAPVFIRAIAAEGKGTGPVHSNCYHSIYMHMPGIPVAAPMTPGEYQEVWDYYMSHDDPILVSEHRRSYLSKAEMPDLTQPNAQITIFPISASRFSALEAVKILEKEGIGCNVSHILWLKPFAPTPRFTDPLVASGLVLVIDSAFEIASAVRSIAYDLTTSTGLPVRALGQFDRSPGCAPNLENGTPAPERIAEVVRGMLRARRPLDQRSCAEQTSKGRQTPASCMAQEVTTK